MEETLNELKYAIEHCQMARKENNEALAGKWADIAHSYLDAALKKTVEVTVTTPITKEEDADLFVKPVSRWVFRDKFKEHYNLGNLTMGEMTPEQQRQYHNDYQYYKRWGKYPWEAK
jgi:hypothetical protein